VTGAMGLAQGTSIRVGSQLTQTWICLIAGSLVFAIVVFAVGLLVRARVRKRRGSEH
jgi:hypothetical protein